MRYFALFLMLASLALFGSGCTKTDQPSADPSPAAEADPASDADATETPDGEPAGEAEEETEEGSSE